MKKIFTSQLDKKIGKKVRIEGWVHDIRLLGGIAFVLLRDKDGIVQVTASKKKLGKEILKEIEKLHQEDVIRVEGKVVRSKIAKRGIEIIPSKIEIISKSKSVLPLDPRGITKTNLDTQLDWRFLYFRTEEGRSIFRIQTQIVNAFRKFFLERGFIEMQPPCIIASASEGGAELFPLPYFEKKAYLAQSPQLYKQMGAISFERVFMVVPVFRAEKFDQPTHLNEIRQMDVEIAFADYEDAMRVLEECLVFILKEVKKDCKKELEILNQKLRIPKIPFKKVTYEQAIEFLRKKGEEIEWGEDFSKTQEKMLGDNFGEAFFIIDWPSELKPFYAMPKEENPKICKAFDLIYKGLEISSGTQRIHDPELLIKRLKEKGLNPEKFKSYIDAFRYGAPYHSGWSIGLERLTMKITGRKNIREVTMFPRDRKRITP